MKKHPMRILALFLTAAMLLVSGAFAAQPKASQYIQDATARISTSAGGTVTVEYEIIGVTAMTMIGASQIVLYTADGTEAETLQYIDPGCGHMMGRNTIRHSGTVSFDGVPGQSYYASVMFFAGNSSGGDVETVTTFVVTA